MQFGTYQAAVGHNKHNIYTGKSVSICHCENLVKSVDFSGQW